jgi:hypothetical protein
MAVILALRMLRQEDGEFVASLGYIVRFFSQKKKAEKIKIKFVSTYLSHNI